LYSHDAMRFGLLPFVLLPLVGPVLGLGCGETATQVPPEPAAAPATSHPAGVAPPSSPSSSAPVAATQFRPPAPPDPPLALHPGGANAVRGEAGLVTSVENHASQAGADVLANGGNAVDAAVAVAFVLAVTHPSAGNIGGGGFMMIQLANGETHAVDFRETAPAAATTKKMMAEIEAGAFGYPSTAVPGTVAGLLLARERFGSRPLPELMAPAIELAAKGHRLSPRAAQSLAWQWDELRRDYTARRIFGPHGKPMKEGERLKQPELAQTLERIAKDGTDGFYRGETARLIVDAMTKQGGDVTAQDLAAYSAKLREPLRISYRGFEVATMPPPSMGGVAVAEILMLMERAKAHEARPGSAESLHLFVEASRRAYSERRKVGADPDFYPEAMGKNPAMDLLSEEHIATWAPPIDPARATPSEALGHDPNAVPRESHETTHFSVVDAAGNAVSCTVTLSASFGAKVVIPGTGIVMSNALGAFSETGVNDTRPGKRMASSMAPTIVSRGGKVSLVVGSPGGDTIPNVIAQVIRNVVDHGQTVDAAVLAGRVHHQWLPDEIRAEKGTPPSKEALAGLERMGHHVELRATPLGDANIILVDPESGDAWGIADPREGGAAVGVKTVKSRAASGVASQP
jgi:gamma-glutamyltranspeptidase/glutathione hydrolase